MKNIYLAGPMRGIPNFNFPAFDYAAAKLRKRGYKVFNPADRDRAKYGDAIANNAAGSEEHASKSIGFSIREALLADLEWICRHADTVAVLPGWETSRGAAAEIATAKALGINIMYLGSEYVRA